MCLIPAGVFTAWNHLLTLMLHILPLFAFACSGPKFTFGQSSVRVEQSSAIRYSNVEIMSLRSNFDICLNYYADACFRSRNFVRVLSPQTPAESARYFFQSEFSVMLMNSLADFEKPSLQMYLLTAFSVRSPHAISCCA